MLARDLQRVGVDRAALGGAKGMTAMTPSAASVGGMVSIS
jgi:hypothetical protein